MENKYSRFFLCFITFIVFMSCDTTTPKMKPSQVILLSPSDNATKQDINMTFSWNSVNTATSYTIQVDTTNSFTTPIINKNITTTQHDGTLNYDKTYYWRVQASNSVGDGLWSAVWQLTTEEGTSIIPPSSKVPEQVTLLSPMDNARNENKDITFMWEGMNTATSYTIQVDTTNSFTTPIINDTVTTTQHDGTLNYDKTYYWRVQASNNVGEGEWSMVWSFITKKAPTFMVSANEKNVNASTGTTTFLIRNDKQSLLTWSATTDASWISFSPMGGTLASAEEETIIVNYDENTNSTKREGKIIFTVDGISEEHYSVTFIQEGTLSTDTLAFMGVLETSQNYIHTMSFSPDGTILATGGSNGIQLWNMNDSSIIRTLGSSASSIAFSPDRTILISGGTDQNIKWWNVNDGSLIRTIQGDQTKFDAMVKAVAFNPNGTVLASGGTDDIVKLWRVSDGMLIDSLKGHTETINSVAFSSDGNVLASGSIDNTVKLWNVSDGSLIRTIIGHKKEVISLTFSPNEEILASGSKDRTIKLWNVSDGSLIRTLNPYSAYGDGIDVTSLAFSPDGTMLASSAGLSLIFFNLDYTVHVWNVSSGEVLYTISEDDTILVHAVAFSPDGTILATNSSSKIKLWRIPD